METTRPPVSAGHSFRTCERITHTCRILHRLKANAAGPAITHGACDQSTRAAAAMRHRRPCKAGGDASASVRAGAGSPTRQPRWGAGGGFPGARRAPAAMRRRRPCKAGGDASASVRAGAGSPRRQPRWGAGGGAPGASGRKMTHALTLRAIVVLLAFATVAAAQSPDQQKLLDQIKRADAEQLAVSEEDGRFLRVMIVSSG